MADRIDAAIDAIAAEVRRRIPTLEEFAAIDNPNDMGPEVTIPAIWMSLLLTHIRGLRVQTRGSLSIRATPKTPDEIAEYAGDLGRHAIVIMEDHLDGAAVLFQAGVAVLMTTLPAEAVLATLQGLPDFFQIQGVLGIGAVRQ